MSFQKILMSRQLNKLKNSLLKSFSPTRHKIVLAVISVGLAVLLPVYLIEASNLYIQPGFPLPIGSLEHSDVESLIGGPSEPDYFLKLSGLSLPLLVLDCLFWYLFSGIVMEGWRELR